MLTYHTLYTPLAVLLSSLFHVVEGRRLCGYNNLLSLFSLLDERNVRSDNK